eukprot:COSAG02_NODE_17780_length_981_cov_1.792517_2_plen_57_part_01
MTCEAKVTTICVAAALDGTREACLDAAGIGFNALPESPDPAMRHPGAESYVPAHVQD